MMGFALLAPAAPRREPLPPAPMPRWYWFRHAFDVFLCCVGAVVIIAIVGLAIGLGIAGYALKEALGP